MTQPEVLLYTDGACSGNPGPGGWAFILKHPRSGKQLEKTGGARETTNNRMELTAVIQGLLALKAPSKVALYTDSEYVGKGISLWMPKWKQNGWRRRDGDRWVEVLNLDLWRQLDELLQVHQVTYHKVLSHTGHPENERCDELAVAACKQFRE